MSLSDFSNEIQLEMLPSHAQYLIDVPESLNFINQYSGALQHFNYLMKEMEKENSNDSKYSQERIKAKRKVQKEFTQREVEVKRQAQKEYLEFLYKKQLVDSLEIEMDNYFKDLNKLAEENLAEFVFREQMTDILFHQKISNQLLQRRMAITKYDIFIAKTPISDDSVRVDVRLEGISDKMKPRLEIEGEAQALGENWGYELHFSKEELEKGIKGMIMYSKLRVSEEIDFELNDNLEEVQVLSSEKHSKNRRPYH